MEQILNEETVLIEYEQVRNKNEIFACKSDKSLKGKTNSVNQKQITNHEKRFCCNSCGKKFTRKINLKRHRQQWHADSEEDEVDYSCDVCGKKCSSQSGLSRHNTRQHGGVKPPDVEKSSFNSEHKQTHTNSSFSCDICEKMFESEFYFVTHKRFHTDETFSCETCEKAFTHLLEHAILKVEDKPLYIKIEKQLHTEIIIKDEEMRDESAVIVEETYENYLSYESDGNVSNEEEEKPFAYESEEKTPVKQRKIDNAESYFSYESEEKLPEEIKNEEKCGKYNKTKYLIRKKCCIKICLTLFLMGGGLF